MPQSPKKTTGTNSDDTLTGTGGTDAIYGLRGRDVLTGLGGSDMLDGGLGGDRMSGGDGDDTYVFDNISDRAIELGNGGIDTVLSSIRMTVLRANMENLTFTNSASHSGFGNGLANVMISASGNDHLLGMGGDDTLSGGGGDDYVSGGAGNDVITGGNGHDTLIGGFGNDLLDGELNGDDMSGGTGNDTYIVDNIADRVFETPRHGTDEVRSSVDFALSANVENLILTGAYSTDGTGNRLNNTIEGNAQKNTLAGMDGNDVLGGGLGNDKLSGGLGADRFVFSSQPNSSNNSDTITDFVHAEGDRIVLSQAIFSDFDTPGRISAGTFYAAPGATRAKEDGQYLIYNTTTGSLYYDAAGPDGRGPIEIAQLGTALHPDLSYADFLIIG